MPWHLSYQLNLWDTHFICDFCCYFTITCRGGKFCHHVWTAGRLSLNEYLQNKIHFFPSIFRWCFILGPWQKSAFKRAKNGQIQIIQAFALCSDILWNPIILLANSKGPDQTARMCRLILAFAVRICPKTFAWHGQFIISPLWSLWAVCAHGFGSWGPGFKPHRRRNSAYDYVKAQGLS